MSEKEIVYTYTVFNRDNWNYNVDKIFFVMFLGLLYTSIRIFQLDFKVSTAEIFIRILTCPFSVIGVIGFIEALFALITKVALEPGIILESKFKVFKVFFKAYLQSMSNSFTFKQVYFIKKIIVNPNPYVSSSLIGIGLNSCYSGSLMTEGYVKIPDHFNY